MKIHIPEPCHEDWGQMTLAEKGKFCDSCAKIVVDFTKMTDDQVKNYFQENASQKTCGRFKKTQVADTNNIYLPWDKIQQLKRYQDKFLIALLIGFGSTLFSCNGDSQTMGDVCIVKDSIEVGVDSLSPKIESLISTIQEDPNDSTTEKSIENSTDFYEIGDVVELTGETAIEETIYLPEVLPDSSKRDSIEITNSTLIGDTIIPAVKPVKVQPVQIEYLLGKSIRANPKPNK